MKVRSKLGQLILCWSLLGNNIQPFIINHLDTSDVLLLLLLITYTRCDHWRERGVRRVKSQWSYLQSTHPAGGPSGQEGEEQTEVTRWVNIPDINTGLGLSLRWKLV